MRLGYRLPNVHYLAARANIQEVAERAEEACFDDIWLSDHICLPARLTHPHHYEDHESHRLDTIWNFYEPLTVLAWVAALTQRPRLGISVVVLPYRNPVTLAKMYATLDQLSGGRTVLGVGIGYLKDEFDILQVPFKDRAARSDEYIQIIKRCWETDEPTFDGRFYKFTNAKFLPQPVQRPGPPIVVGGDTRAAADRAGRLADGWTPFGISPEDLKAMLPSALDRVREGGGDPKRFEVIPCGSLDLRERPLASDRRRFSGSPEQVIDDIRRYERAGATAIAFDYYQTIDMEKIRRNITLFAKEVRPAIQRVS